MKFSLRAVIGSLILSWTAIASAIQADFSGAQLINATGGSVVLENVLFGDLQKPVWMEFVWDSESKALKLTGIGNAIQEPRPGLFPTGEWTLNYDWGCNSPDAAPIQINTDGTFLVQGDTGTWTFNVADNVYSHTFGHIDTTYTGTYDNQGTVAGRIYYNKEDSGCFTMVYGHSTESDLIQRLTRGVLGLKPTRSASGE